MKSVVLQTNWRRRVHSEVYGRCPIVVSWLQITFFSVLCPLFVNPYSYNELEQSRISLIPRASRLLTFVIYRRVHNMQMEQIYEKQTQFGKGTWPADSFHLYQLTGNVRIRTHYFIRLTTADWLQPTLPGFEPGIFWSLVRRVIHCCTGPQRINQVCTIRLLSDIFCAF